MDSSACPRSPDPVPRNSVCSTAERLGGDRRALCSAGFLLDQWSNRRFGLGGPTGGPEGLWHAGMKQVQRSFTKNRSGDPVEVEMNMLPCTLMSPSTRTAELTDSRRTAK